MSVSYKAHIVNNIDIFSVDFMNDVISYIDNKNSTCLIVVMEIDRVIKGIKEDIAQNAQEYERKAHEAAEKEERNQQLLEQVSEFADRYGRKEETTIAVGAGGGLIGMRLEYTSCLVTPTVEITQEEEIVSLRVVEELESYSGYRFGTEGFSLRAKVTDKDGNIGEEQKWFTIKGEETENWRGEEATMEQIDMASAVLKHMESTLNLQDEFDQYSI